MMAEPTLTPVTIPDAASTVATAVFELLHPPPVVAVLRVVVPPTHAAAVPVIEATVGAALMVTDLTV
ncbi:hypothetical protein GCM10011375_09410 [Hymenobacter qilianensis]|uniref:Uncharacterized protein n=1 Tax=Hymenobacter qilianensis TaxID=1385715 RepID=A0ACB5PNJ3_9BACT|nr:hypothetical protein GCM10011375_09410 [Hymenobacter qilianensis]